MPEDSGLVDAAVQTQAHEGVAYRVMYAIDPSALAALEKLGIDVSQDIIADYTGIMYSIMSNNSLCSHLIELVLFLKSISM